jgi:drug/metabolite transporter (DMT)-like permease
MDITRRTSRIAHRCRERSLHRIGCRRRCGRSSGGAYVIGCDRAAGEKLSTTQKLGLSLILSGALIIVGLRGTTWSISRSVGDVLFLVASFLSAGYTVIMRKSKLAPVHVAALVATGSLAVYAPLYFGIRGLHLAQVPVADLTIQVIFQGIVVIIISLVHRVQNINMLGSVLSFCARPGRRRLGI